MLVEKPFAVTLADCRELVDAADRAGVTLMVAQNQRFLPPYRAAKARARRRRARARSAASASTRCSAGRRSSRRATGTTTRSRAGGGVVISVAVHRIDLMRYLVGDVVRVSAVCRTTRPEYVNGAEDQATATLELANGALGEMFATSSAFRMPWSESFMIFGDDGTMHAAPAPGNIRGPAVVASSRRTPPATEWLDQVAGFRVARGRRATRCRATADR